jgi:carbamoyltransferase
MIVLGIKHLDHDTGACIISDRDGHLRVTAICEARLNRNKHSYFFPFLSIKYCLDSLGLRSIDRVDLVAFEQFNYTWPEANSPLGLEFAAREPNKGKKFDYDEYTAYLAEQSLAVPRDKIRWFGHIECHAASAYYASPFDDAATLVVEGGLGLYKGRNLELSCVDRYGYYGPLIRDGVAVSTAHMDDVFSPAHAFLRATKLLFQDWFGSGQVMALAAYADRFKRVDHIGIPRKRFFDFLVMYDTAINRLKEMEKRLSREQIMQDGYLNDLAVNLAREMQKNFEEDMLHLAELARERVPSENIALAGGSALSCVANRLIYDSGLFKSIFIQPAASDEGLALGAALCGYYASGGRKRWRMDHAYLGRANDAKDLPAILERHGLPYRRAAPAEVARLLADGKIIARVAGGSEYGPRALGNRSFLADPRRPDMVATLNVRVKKRDGFRPFAPSCLWERVGDYFDLPVEGPFMILAAPVKPEARHLVPAVVHVDGSTRPQTVRREQNPDYYELIEEFGRLTGVYVLLNTSFNGKGEPIVETYEDAIKCFLETGIDYLYVEGLLVERLPAAQASAVETQAEKVSRLNRAYEAARGGICDPGRWSALAAKIAERRSQLARTDDGRPTAPL